MWLELVLAISDEYSASVILESLKVDYTVTSLGKVKRSFITHTHRVHTIIILWVVEEIVPLFISLRTESITPTIIRDFNLHVGHM